MNCFMLYMPGEERCLKGASERLLRFIETSEDCFIFSKFGISEPFLAIPLDSRDLSDEDIDGWINANDIEYSSRIGVLTQEASKDSHSQYIRQVQKSLEILENQTGHPCKIIAARQKGVRCHASATSIFHKLKALYPQAFIFLYSTPQSGTWLGASPELVAKIHDGEFSTMSLAGTRPASIETNVAWDVKNIEEQEIVTHFIMSTLRQNGIKAKAAGPYTKFCGPVAHLATDISASLPTEYLHNRCKTELLLWSITPTPAISGFPKEAAIREILQHEKGNRRCYGGCVGFANDDNVEIFVNLRSGLYNSANNEMTLYAGGGITRRSDPDEEWLETERKLYTMLKALLPEQS